MHHFSIITVNKNNAIGLRYTADSIKNQIFKDFEWIIIDAASSDDSISIIKEYSQFISYWISESDKGIYDGMNKGIIKSHGEYLLFLNSGDALADNFVMEKLVNYKFDDDVVIGAVNVCDVNHNIMIHNHSIKNEQISMFDFYLFGIPHQASLIKRVLFDNYGLYDLTVGMNADWKFFLDTLILSNCSLKKIDCIISNYDNSGISSLNIDKVRVERKNIFDNVIPKRIASDYDKVFPVYYEVYRIEWLLRHPFFYKIYRAITTLGRKIIGAN
jgi:glycosyltransferase involved in cell wall biosynthesis